MKKGILLLIFSFSLVASYGQSSKNYLSDLKNKLKAVDAGIVYSDIKTGRKGKKILIKSFNLANELIKTELVIDPGSPDETRSVKSKIFDKNYAIVQYRGQKIVHARYPSDNGRMRVLLYYGRVNHQWEEDGNRKGKFRKPSKPN